MAAKKNMNYIFIYKLEHNNERPPEFAYLQQYLVCDLYGGFASLIEKLSYIYNYNKLLLASSPSFNSSQLFTNSYSINNFSKIFYYFLPKTYEDIVVTYL